jgi:D-alanine-D-alanine ligase
VSSAPLKVAVLMGGPSAEAVVSRSSAAEVGQALSASGHTVSLLELDSGCAAALLGIAPDVVFPALHGPPGEDGTVQGFLEILGLPYVGSGVHGSALAMDKSLAKYQFRAAGLPVADDCLIQPGADPCSAAARVRETLGDRVVVKPLRQGSAIGVTRLPNGGDPAPAIAEALAFGHGVLVERFVPGREITVGVLDLHGRTPQALPVIEIRTASDEWYDFTNRYAAGKSEHVMPPDLPADVLAGLQTIALQAHRALGLRDLSRADFLVTDRNEIVLLEVNTLPGMTPTSLFPDAANAIGLPFPALTDALVRSALARGLVPG